MSDTQFSEEHDDLPDSRFGAMDGIASIVRGTGKALLYLAVALAIVVGCGVLAGFLQATFSEPSQPVVNAVYAGVSSGG